MKQNQSYLWQGVTLEGGRHSGLIEANHKALAMQELKKKGIFGLTLKGISNSIINTELSDAEKADFLSSLILFLESGLSMEESVLTLVSESKSLKMRYLFSSLYEELHKGRSVKDSFAKNEKMFSPFLVSFIAITEKSNRFIESLTSLKQFFKSKDLKKQEIVKLLRRPKLLAFFAILLVFGVAVFIVPMFRNIYMLFGDDLPIPTKVLVNISIIARRYYLEFLLVSAFLAFISFYARSWKHNPLVILKKLLKPKFLKQDEPLLYSQAIQLLLLSGNSIKDAIQEGAKSISIENRKHAIQISEHLERGYGVADAFQNNKWFPRVFSSIISINEKAGNLSRGFLQVSRVLERERDEKFNRISKLIEPVTMVLLGGIILGILLGVYLPIFDLGNKIG